MKAIVVLLFSILAPALAMGEPKSCRVFVALCDNKTQGIVPVGERIGDGDQPEANLYWGCSDGLGSYFGRSKKWEIVGSSSDLSEAVLRRLQLRHVSGKVDLVADAYRGSRMQDCLRDFELAVASGNYDLVAFIGHNGHMDFQMRMISSESNRETDVIVLCCHSQRFFEDRMKAARGRPILMTQQLMYPGSFILHDALEVWMNRGTLPEIRKAAGRAYAKNQKISTRAATGIFADLKE